MNKDFTAESIKRTISLLKPYKIYGTKENLDMVRDKLPPNIEAVDLPDNLLIEEMKHKVYLIDMSSSYEITKIIKNDGTIIEL